MKFAAQYGLQPGLTFEENVTRIRRAGYGGIELSTAGIFEGRARPLEESEMPELCARARNCGDCARAAGLEIIGLVPPYFALSYFEAPVFENYYRLAQAMGAPAIRVFGMLYDRKKGYRTLFRKTQDMLKTLLGYGARYGVRSLLELHPGNLNESCSGAYLVMRDFDPKLIGAIHDPQNMVLAGRENWRMGLEILGDYLAYVHCKDSYFARNDQGQWKSIIVHPGEGLVNWKEFAAALKDTGFQGYLCNENRMDKTGLQSEAYLEQELAFLQGICA